MEIQKKLEYICREFRIPGKLIKYRLIPSGHINTTYYVAFDDGIQTKEYLVQMVNWYVFREPVSMMNNIDMITRHIMKKEAASERRRRVHFHHTDSGDNFLILNENDEKQFWRVSNFIEDSVSFETADGDPKVLRMAGKAFGRFEAELEDFDATSLVESIPHFHDTRTRLNNFFADVEADPCGRVKSCTKEIETIRANRDFACTLCRQIDEGILPIRVTHNDTKTNNVLFDRETLEPLVVIDLDTCMPGLAAYDFGDTIRFAACPGAEDDTDLSKMKVDMRLFRAFTEGYIGEMAPILSDAELSSMATGCAVITLELASRFLDDYIVGDKYFRIDYSDHNLVRTRAQLALFEDMMKHLTEMDKIVHQVAEKARKKQRKG